MSSIFKDFTNLYSLPKTLRFSLIPVLTKKQEESVKREKGYSKQEEITRQDRIEKFFNENKKDIFEADIERKKRYKALKYYLTELHKLFIKDALEKVKSDDSIDFSKLFNSYEKYENCKDDNQKKKLSNDINDEKVKLAKIFGDKEGKGGVFQKTAQVYHIFLKERLEEKEKIKGGDDEKKGFATGAKNILLSQNILRILEEKIKGKQIQEKTENDKDGNNKYSLNNVEYLKKGELKTGTLTEYFDGWSTYFKNFNEIRGNLYKDNGRKDDDEGSEDETKIIKANAGQLTTRILDENFEIFVRNAVWAKNNKKNLSPQDFSNKDVMNDTSIFGAKFYVYCLLQKDINIYNSKIAEMNKFFNENKINRADIKYLKPLCKQLLLTDKPDGEEDVYIEEFTDDEDLVEGLDQFHKHSQYKIAIIQNFLKDGKVEDNLDEIQLNENQLHFFCNKYFGSWSYLRDLYYRQNKVEDEKQGKKGDELRDKEGVVKRDISLAEIKALLETELHFQKAIRKGWFCRDFNDSSQSSVASLRDAGVFREGASNFDNFIAFLKFDISSLLNGRDLLTNKEKEDRNKITKTKQSLEYAKNDGQRVDDLLLSKFSQDNFVKNFEEGMEEKQERFELDFDELKASILNKKRLTRERDFECKKAVNEYCTRVSDINAFFALFNVPEGVTGSVVNTTVQKFKKDNKIAPLFNAIRNYITRRTDEMEKIKLNFDTQTLMGGWAYKTTDYKCRILEKEGNYYLLIIGKATEQYDTTKDSLIQYKMMNYYQQKGQTIFGSVYKGKFDSDYDTDRKNQSTMIKNIEKLINELIKNFPKSFPVEAKSKNKLDLVKDMINDHKFDFGITKDDFLNQFAEKAKVSFYDYRDKKGLRKKEDVIIEILKEIFGEDKFDYQTEKEYLVNRIKEITKKNAAKTDFLGSDRLVYEITKLEPYFYKNSFRPVNIKEEDSILNGKEFFLFQIYCKDFSIRKHPDSTKNLHTLYFEELFSEANQENPIFKLSGGGEVFFREKIDDYKIEQWERKDLKSPKTNKTPNKKRRLTENQILFHVPIVLNNINDGGSINRKVHECIQKNEDVKILGIDRGEKELAYYCLLDQNGKIIDKPKTLNIVGSNIIKDKDGSEKKQAINYRQKLDVKEKERMMARRSWTKIEGIKDLKAGYISNVVNEIAKLMINDNTFVCLEELNHGFKKDRSIRIEKGVYQRLENALVDKLNYLVCEKTPKGVRNALQLTPENKALKYWGNQMGTIFYTDAKFTSKTCPHCGFRRRGVESMKTAEEVKEKIKKEQLKAFFEKDKDRFRIEYNWKVEAFEFSCEDLYGKGVMEVIYSDVERSSWNNDSLKHIFKDYLQDNVELFSLVKNDVKFSYVDFGEVFNSLTWLRHTVEKDKDGEKFDCISCPKCHFSTMSSKTQKITNGDANGAYNIARRGLMIFEKIRSDKLRKKMDTKNGIESKDLKVNLKEWDEETYRQWDKRDWEDTINERCL